ncbi:hypothetical protein Q7C36_019169 [Tachysurus vachellii]|uniref:Uncharacterized protein n=1 Tax=Tachysurus vachellii TaxID=175792 RepID=A0AA88S7U3_TACVA|nr:hypothetical protein Q7C36_019169 [Tachysurus vachellii]
MLLVSNRNPRWSAVKRASRGVFKSASRIENGFPRCVSAHDVSKLRKYFQQDTDDLLTSLSSFQRGSSVCVRV